MKNRMRGQRRGITHDHATCTQVRQETIRKGGAGIACHIPAARYSGGRLMASKPIKWGANRCKTRINTSPSAKSVGNMLSIAHSHTQERDEENKTLIKT